MNFEALALQAERAESLLKVIGNRHRLMLLCALHEGEQSVSALHERGGLSQSSLSQHLARLRSEGVVTTRRDAQSIYYSLADTKVTHIIATLHTLYCEAASCPSDKEPHHEY